MTDEQINKDLHEKVMGLEWHVNKYIGDYTKDKWNCSCGFQTEQAIEIIDHPSIHPDYLNSWDDYGGLVKVVSNSIDNLAMEYLKKHENQDELDAMLDFIHMMLNSRQGSTAIWEFFCKEAK